MRKILSIFLAVLLVMSLCTAAFAAETYNYSYTEKQEIESLLSTFRWYWRDYNCAEALQAVEASNAGILSAVVENPLPVDYSKYPVEQPDMAWSIRRDPLGKWTSYWRFPETSVEWVLRYVFGLTQNQITSLRDRIDAGVDTRAYRYGGYYYSWPGGVGGGYEAVIQRMTKDGYFYRVDYRLSGGDGYWEDMGNRFAVLSRSNYNGRDYWTLRYDSTKRLASDVPFLDVTANAFYTEGVQWANQRGVTSGTSEFLFSPQESCTRGQIVTFLWRAKGSPEPKTTRCPFVDVSTSGFYYKAMLWAVETGVTEGLDSTHFGPNEPCTRAQAVTFLWRAEGSPVPASAHSSFTDVNSKGFYYQAMLWAGEQNITKGATATRFEPQTVCTRGHIVTFLYRDLAG